MIVEGARAAGHEVVGLVSGWRTLRDSLPSEAPEVRANWVPRVLNPFFMDVLRWPSVESLLGPTDIFVATNYCMPPARRASSLALLHDVGRLSRPELYNKRQVMRARFMARRCARFADLLVVPTEAIAREVVDVGLASARRVRVVPWGVRRLPAPEPEDVGQMVGDDPLLLCVSTLERRKNVHLAVRAFQKASHSLPHHLVVAGGRGSASAEVFAAARENGAADRIHFVGHADEHQLSALYDRADVVICPSLYEGFGLTLLEAMASGCPVLASDIPAHREVGGGAVRFVPPDDEGAFIASLIDLVRDERARADMRTLGLERSRRFSWQETRQQFGALLSSRCVLS